MLSATLRMRPAQPATSRMDRHLFSFPGRLRAQSESPAASFHGSRASARCRMLYSCASSSDCGETHQRSQNRGQHGAMSGKPVVQSMMLHLHIELPGACSTPLLQMVDAGLVSFSIPCTYICQVTCDVSRVQLLHSLPMKSFAGSQVL